MINEIKAHLSIIDLCVRLGIKVNSSNFIFSIYKQEKSPSLKLYPKTNTFFCFATNQGGDIIKLYQDFYNVTTKEAIKELANICVITNSGGFSISHKNRIVEPPTPEIVTMDLLESEKEYFEERSAIIHFEANQTKERAEALAYQLIIEERKNIQYRIYKQLFSFCMLEGIEESALKYLTGKQRGLTTSAIKYFKIFSIHSAKKTVEYLKSTFNKDELIISGLFTAKDYFVFAHHRIIIPYLENEEIKYLRGRYFYKSTYSSNTFGKYIGLSNYSGTLTAKRIYNLDILKSLSPNSDLVISEGEFDCIVLNQVGINAVAIAGVSNLPKESIPLLSNYNIYLCFDNDSAGIKAIEDISTLFNKPIKQIKLKNFKDITELVTNGNNE